MKTIYSKFAVYILVQSFVLSAVFSRSVQIDQTPRAPTFHEFVTDVPHKNDFEEIHSGASPTESLQDFGGDDDTNLDSFPLRLKRRPNGCLLRVKIKWNHCLGKLFPEFHCRRQSVTCLSRDNIPPKCKKHIKIVFGDRGGCPVVSGCTCAA